MNPVPFELVEELFTEMEKSAKMSDSLEAEVRKLKSENDVLRAANKKQASVFFSPDMLSEAIHRLDSHDLLPEGLTVEKAASLICQKPDRVLHMLVSLVPETRSEGRPVKRASTTLPDGSKLIQLNGKTLVDDDGWGAAVGLA